MANLGRKRLDTDGLAENAKRRIMINLLSYYFRNDKHCPVHILTNRKHKPEYQIALNELVGKGLVKVDEKKTAMLASREALKKAFRLHDGLDVESI